MLQKESQSQKLHPFKDNHFYAIRFQVKVFLIFFSIMWLAKSGGFCGERSWQEPATPYPEVIIRKVAFLPLKNLSMSDEIPPDIITLMSKGLVNKKKVKVISQEAVETFLIRERIRDTSSIGKATVRQMGKILKVDGIVLTYMDLLVSGEDPMVGVGCRMVSGNDGSLIWTRYTALTGRDFVSWLGIGKVNSLEKLAQMAVERLVLGFPEKVKVEIDDSAPFEIAEIMVNPRHVHSNDRINVQMKLASIGEIPFLVKAILGDQERILLSKSTRGYAGIFSAPIEEGKYPLKIQVLDREGNASNFDAVATIQVDNTPPRVTTYYQDELFSPNRDNINDTVIFFPYLEEPDTVENWRLIVEDSEGNGIRKLEEKGGLPRALVWRGENDSYSIVEDGIYYFRLIVKDEAGNVAETTPKPIIIDKTPPLAQITGSIWKNEGFRFTLDCKDKNGIGQWQLAIHGPDGRIIHFFEGDGEAPSYLEWETNISNLSNISNISYSFEAKDLAGNTKLIGPQFIKGELVTKRVSLPRKEEKRKKWDYYF